MKRGHWNKYGQFYLVSAVILASIIIGISFISNYSQAQGTSSISELRDQIQIESSKTVTFGLAHNYDSNQMNNLLENFTGDYISTDQNNNLYFMFGTPTDITLVAYQTFPENISLYTGDGYQTINVAPKTTYTKTYSISEGGQIKIKLDNSTHGFTLTTGENFYFVISQSVNNNDYIVTN